MILDTNALSAIAEGQPDATRTFAAAVPLGSQSSFWANIASEFLSPGTSAGTRAGLTKSFRSRRCSRSMRRLQFGMLNCASN